ncbi:MAG TPA: hypothetical protein VII52_13205 [Gemmatimonadaceae bacterium]
MNSTGKLALLGCAALVAACSDSVAPRSASGGGPALDAPETGAVSMSREGWKKPLTQTDTDRFSITIDPSAKTSYVLGTGNVLTFPAGSVCDPAQSSYGEGEWDKPCIVARTAITVTVKAWLDATGHPQTDFSPNLRFVPSTLSSHWVEISFGDSRAAFDPRSAILYCRDPHARCIDEAKKDPSLATTRDPLTGKVMRRIKHFSGYLVGAGDSRFMDDSWNMTAAGSALAAPVVAAPAPPSPSLPAAASRAKAPSAPAVRQRAKTGYILVSG